MAFFENEKDEGRTLCLRVGDRQKDEFEVAGDFILPDSLADIKRILTVSGELHPDEGRVENGKAVSTGEALFRILFVTDTGEVRTASFTTTYENRSALTAPEGNPTAVFLPRLVSVSARAVNPRKVGIRAKVNAGTAGWEERDSAPVFPEHLNDADRLSFETLESDLTAASFTCFSASGVESGDDVPLPEGKPPVQELLFTGLGFSALRSETRENGVQINGDAELTFVYNGAAGAGESNGEIVFFRHKVPVSYLLEAPGTREGDTVIASLTPGKVVATPAEGLDGSARLIEVDFTYGIQAMVGREQTCPVVRDIYSTVYDTQAVMTTVTVNRDLGKATLKEKIRGECAFKEEAAVLGVIPQAGIQGYHEDGGKCRIDGSALLQVVLKEADGSVVAESVSIPFALDSGLFYGKDPEYSAVCDLTDVSARLADGKITAEATLCLAVCGRETCRESVVGGVSILRESVCDSPASFTVYYPTKNETIWDIAKKFQVPKEALIVAEESGDASARRALIIPQKKKAVFRGVIDG